MRIHILCGQGSQNGVHLSDIYGKNGRVGVGGSEYALLTMCEAWTKRGDEVILYNNPTKQDGVFEQRSVDSFVENDKGRDVLIIFRQPTTRVEADDSFKVFWSCDQYTEGNFRYFSRFVKKIVTISPFHTEYFKKTYGIENAQHIDLPVRIWDYDIDVPKVSNRIIFTSVPDRGLNAVKQSFNGIRDKIPDATLVITSDYRLWGSYSPNNSQFLNGMMGMENVQFLGAVSRERLIREQLAAQIHFYPFTGETEELFCISVAESQVAGVLPITSTDGALGTTNMGVTIEGNARDGRNLEIFIKKTVEYLSNPELPNIQAELSKRARERFGVEKIMKTWDDEVFNG